MKIYVVEGILDEVVQLGFSLSRSSAEKEAKYINEKCGGIGYSGAEVWVTEYECDSEYTEFE